MSTPENMQILRGWFRLRTLCRQQRRLHDIPAGLFLTSCWFSSENVAFGSSAVTRLKTTMEPTRAFKMVGFRDVSSLNCPKAPLPVRSCKNQDGLQGCSASRSVCAELFDTYLAQNAGKEPSHSCPADENLHKPQCQPFGPAQLLLGCHGEGYEHGMHKITTSRRRVKAD